MKINFSEFLTWAFSNCLDNLVRGKLGEYIVAKALNIKSVPFTSWESYDFKTEEGIKIEVKTSAYLQVWPQKELSNISWSIAKKRGWIGMTDEWEKEVKRSADIYIFCLLNEKDRNKIDPLNTDQWIFYVVPTSFLNETMPDQKTVTRGALEKCGFLPVKFEMLQQVLANI